MDGGGIAGWYQKKSKGTKIALWVSSVGVITLAIFFSTRYLMRKMNEKEVEAALNENRAKRFQSVLNHLEEDVSKGDHRNDDLGALASKITSYLPPLRPEVVDQCNDVLELLTDANSIYIFLIHLQERKQQQQSKNGYTSSIYEGYDDDTILQSVRLAIYKIELAHSKASLTFIECLGPVGQNCNAELQILRQMESRILLRQRRPVQNPLAPVTNVWEQLDR